MTMERRWALIGHVHDADTLGEVFAVDNVGTGAEVHKETVTVNGVPTAHLRSLVSSDGSIIISQNVDEIDFSCNCGNNGGSVLDITTVGAADLACGPTQTIYPAVLIPDLAVGDLLVWVLYVGVPAGFSTSGEAGITVPPGWSPYVLPKYYANDLPACDTAIVYKWADQADLNPSTSHTLLSGSSGNGYVCGRLHAYRGVNSTFPLGQYVTSTLVQRHPWFNFTPYLPAETSQQAAISILTRYDGTFNNSGDFNPTWPLGPDIETSKDFIHQIPGYSEVYTKIMAFTGTGADDENWIPNENYSQSLGGLGWTQQGVINITRDPNYNHTSFDASSTYGRHYIEREVVLEAGKKYSFWLCFLRQLWNYNDNSMNLGVSYVDPSGNERGFAFEGPGGYFDLKDPLSDHNSVWYGNNLGGFDGGGVPNDMGGIPFIYFTAQEDGVHKIRISAVAEWGAWEFSGTENEDWLVSNVVFREGWRSPTPIYTDDNAVYAGSNMGVMATPGWALSNNSNTWTSRYKAFPIMPDGYISPIRAIPWTTLSGLSWPYTGYIEQDGVTLRKGNAISNNKILTVGPSRPVYPVYDGARRKYYCEFVFAEAGSSWFLVVHPLGSPIYGYSLGPSFNVIGEHNYSVTPSGYTSFPAGTTYFGQTDVLGVMIDFETNSSEAVVTVTKNGVAFDSYTFDLTLGQWHPDEPWSVVFSNHKGTGGFFGQRVVCNYTGPFAYKPAGYVGWDIAYVTPPPTTITNVVDGSCASGVSLVDFSDPNYPAIKGLLAGQDVSIVDTGGGCLQINVIGASSSEYAYFVGV